MQVSTKFTIAIHILAAASYFGKDHKVTSVFLAGSIGCNPVIVRNLMMDLKKAGLISVRRGPGGVEVTRPLDQITFRDVYDAVETRKDRLFNFHENPNPLCPVGRNIHQALDGKLLDIQKQFQEDLRGHTLAEVVGDLQKAIGSQ
ncbi:MAG: Rrf2 family transcriptional regulator [Acidaminococcus fermentans]|uniref:Rrf2 family transcriptional regulator n=1 Tax=Acidaminococcus fermentans TaxID=905 RepID=UPI00242C8860|nr:Rrf2 family transcriptional regulator [Acidaminococcus fermentans]MDD7195592.1 Rrf2 family transcriptional regulator [Acidaminococcus fermentans]